MERVTAFFRRCFAYREVELVGRVLPPGFTRRGEVRKKGGTPAEAFELGRRLAGENPVLRCAKKHPK